MGPFDCLWMKYTWTVDSTDIFTQKYFIKLKLFLLLLGKQCKFVSVLKFFGEGIETEEGVLKGE